MTKLDFDKVAENLRHRHDHGELAMETAVLRVVLETMMSIGSRYRKAEYDQAGEVYRLSLQVLSEKVPTSLPELTPIMKQQAKVFTMFGPQFGFVTNFAVTQPADFYFDSRTGSAKFPKREILKEVAKLVTMATEAGLDPHRLSGLPFFHNCGIW